MIEPPSLNRGRAFWTVKEGAAHVEVEGLVEVFFGDLSDLGELACAGAGKEDIDPALLALDGLVEAVEVVEVGCVSLDPR